jgi:hypothetical protein
MPQLRTRCDAHHKKALCVGQERRVVCSADGALWHTAVPFERSRGFPESRSLLVSALNWLSHGVSPLYQWTA